MIDFVIKYHIWIRQSKEDLGKTQPKQETNCTITLYSNGFIVNDGSFRDYNDPTNKKFMEDLNKGYSLWISNDLHYFKRVVPQELKNKFPNGLSVALADKRSEKFELPPPPKYIAFSGKGTSVDEAALAPQHLQVKNPNEVLPPQVLHY